MTDRFTEKEFFLNAFHATTLTFLLHEGSDLAPDSLEAFSRLLEELLHHHGRALILFHDQPAVRAALHPVLSPLLPESSWISCQKELQHALLRLLEIHKNVRIIAVDAPDQTGFLARATAFAAAMRFRRVILADTQGGLHDTGGGGFVKPDRLERLLQGELPPLAPRLATLRAVDTMLKAGVGAVSLCRLEELERELFTYEGSGTFFSHRDYCLVRPLGWDDFPEVEAIMRRGTQEGYLLQRSREQMLEILMVGYGAFIADHRLAGVCGLLTAPYGETGMGEIVSLYTLTRFLGEGVGGELLHHLHQAARQQGVQSLFACTQRGAVVGFFQRHGYQVVTPQEIPAAKWREYDEHRKERVICLRRNLREV